jgi:Mannosyl-glycoprotein endo-beta-N-acetylglucosaminidase
MPRFIRPHHLLIATLIVACFATISYGPSRGTVIASGQVVRPAASVEARGYTPARLVAGASKYDVRGSPSISIATIEKVLKQYNSPAIGNGQAFYDLGVKYGVDPSYMLASYVEESSAGTKGAAVATKSVGNLICSGWAGRCIGRFRVYDSYTQAAEDWYQLITGNLYIGAGLITVGQITPRYAPVGENDPSGYAHTVERLVDDWRGRKSG